MSRFLSNNTFNLLTLHSNIKQGRLTAIQIHSRYMTSVKDKVSKGVFITLLMPENINYILVRIAVFNFMGDRLLKFLKHGPEK